MAKSDSTRLRRSGASTARHPNAPLKPTGHNEAIQYKPEIDGLRTIAVLPVVLFHAGVPAFSGGYVGVDVFFVISGFLITRILDTEMGEARFSILRFYERRARRLLPALFMMIFVVSLVSAQLLLAPALEHYAKSMIAALFFASNIWFWRRGGDYFADDLHAEPLLHTWSLAVEEQFYLVFPLLLLALYRFAPKNVVGLIATIAVISFVASVVGAFFRPVMAFYVLPTRAWELGIGSLLALGAFGEVRAPHFRQMLGVFGLGAIAIAVFIFDSTTTFPGFAAGLPVAGAAALLWVAASGSSTTTTLLSLPLFVGIGRISYSLYLWHWPVIVLLKLLLGAEGLTPLFLVAAIALSFVLAVGSYRYIEAPFRRGYSRAQIFGLSGVGAGLLAAMAMVVLVGSGLPNRFGPRETLIASASSDFVECPGRPLQDRHCLIGRESTVPTFALWGDSHAMAIAPAMDTAAAALGLAGVAVTNYSCPPLLSVARPERPACRHANERFIHYLDRERSIRRVIMTARWPVWRTGERAPGEEGKVARLVDSETNDLKQAPGPLFDRSVARTLGALRERGIDVVVLSDVPEIGWNVPHRLLTQERFGIGAPAAPTRADLMARHQAVNAVLRREVDRIGGLFIDIASPLCRPICIVEHAGRPFYIDSNHLTSMAARSVMAPIITPALR